VEYKSIAMNHSVQMSWRPKQKVERRSQKRDSSNASQRSNTHKSLEWIGEDKEIGLQEAR
jgi:hypothetical protein